VKEQMSREQIEQLRDLAANSRFDFGGLPIPRLCDQAILAIEYLEQISEMNQALDFQRARVDQYFNEDCRLRNIIQDILPFAEYYLDHAPSHPGHAKLETARAAIKP
jgi:hypothetical protein